jgi:hypothetical protein
LSRNNVTDLVEVIAVARVGNDVGKFTCLLVFETRQAHHPRWIFDTAVSVGKLQ